MERNTLYYGDNLDVLRKYIKDEMVDLCYIDPPFNSKRNYNQIYNNIGSEDRAQAQAFIDTWVWDQHAIEGFTEILENATGYLPRRAVELIRGLHKVLGEGSLLAYLVSMILRVSEIHRVLKSTGSFYLHCDPTASHYLKLVLDAIFLPYGGHYQNEITWCYGSGGASKRHYSRKHDVIFFYTKSDAFAFHVDDVREPYSSPHKSMTPKNVGGKLYTKMNPLGRIPFDWWQIPILTNSDKERLGYPTQKPESLLEKIVMASSGPDDIVLDAYCGCGTTVAVAQRLNRRWIGIDITFQSISLILKRMEDTFGKPVADAVILNGVPRDISSAVALARKRDDRVRKEFEKWAVLTYTNNRGIINNKKGADAGIDGTVYFITGPTDSAAMVFQVKSGGVGRGDIAKLRGDMAREGAAMATLITLEKPTAPMIAEAKAAGLYHHAVMERNYEKIQIVTAQQIIEEGVRLNIPLSRDPLRSAQRAKAGAETLSLGLSGV